MVSHCHMKTGRQFNDQYISLHRGDGTGCAVCTTAHPIFENFLKAFKIKEIMKLG